MKSPELTAKRYANLKSLILMTSLAATVGLSAGEDPVRRISLDGKDGVVAPALEPGRDKIERIHKVEQPQLMLFPTAKPPARGTVMVCPGGGYGILAVTHEGTDVAKMLNALGWDAAVLLYHVRAGDQTRELALADAQTALALLQQRGGDFGLTTTRLGVMGFSAGGHLAARLTHAAAAAGHPPAFVGLIYPAYLEKDGKCLDEVAPTPVPAFVYVAKDDPFLKSSQAFEAACKNQQLPCQATYASGGGHGFGLKSPLPAAVSEWPAKFAAFLKALP